MARVGPGPLLKLLASCPLQFCPTVGVAFAVFVVGDWGLPGVPWIPNGGSVSVWANAGPAIRASIIAIIAATARTILTRLIDAILLSHRLSWPASLSLDLLGGEKNAISLGSCWAIRDVLGLGSALNPASTAPKDTTTSSRLVGVYREDQKPNLLTG